MEWAAPYIGIPFADRGRDRAGCDCWGLVRLVLAEQFGRLLPSYDEEYESARDKASVSGLLSAGRAGRLCAPVAAPREGDIVLLRVMGLPWHVGLVVGDGWMLHTMRGISSALERYDGPLWRHRVLGFYRPA